MLKKIWRNTGKVLITVGLLSAGVGIGTGISGYMLLKLNNEGEQK